MIFEGVKITGLEVCSYNERGILQEGKNELYTFFMKSDIDLSRGLDFSPQGPILVRLTHLNHEDFVYTIRVQNTKNQQLVGTVRIFIAPALRESEIPMTVTEQRHLMIELDRFVAECLSFLLIYRILFYFILFRKIFKNSYLYSTPW